MSLTDIFLISQKRSGPYYYPEKTGFALKVQNFLVKLGLRNAEKMPGKRWFSEGYRLEELVGNFFASFYMINLILVTGTGAIQDWCVNPSLPASLLTIFPL